MTTQLVWFKRDLRIADHAALTEAARRGPCVCLYVYEPELLHSAEFDASHLVFINQSLRELDAALRGRGARLVTRVGEVTAVLDRLQRSCQFGTLWSHQETGNRITYERDRRVAAWTRSRGVVWRELPNHGVFRRLANRDGWARRWESLMSQPLLPPPTCVPDVNAVRSAGIRAPEALGLAPSKRVDAVAGGESVAFATLDSFLQRRGVNYRADMSSPVQGWNGCSRLSPYLAWGNLSLRQVVQAVRRRSAELKELRALGKDIDRRWLPSLSSFSQRLHWHCHFIQKLEDEPDI
jgi:deoxyribodipyrimidine photo-lyase